MLNSDFLEKNVANFPVECKYELVKSTPDAGFFQMVLAMNKG
jgi:hypothetical protein